MLADEVAGFIERESREQNLSAYRETHYPRREIGSRGDDTTAAFGIDHADFTGMDAGAHGEAHFIPRPVAHRILKQQRKAHRLRDAARFGKIAVSHVLQDADIAFAGDALEVPIVRAQGFAVSRDAVPRLQFRGADDVGEKQDGESGLRGRHERCL